MLNAETRKQEIAFAYAQNIEKGSQNSKGTNGTGNSNAGSNSNQDNGNSNT
ncbi:MAG: hypothetical protein H6766_04880 [Candidatus Peribacteria bacterium]|nr:MAG: hypothetical protein H6766_04880 [Candidatus Peribacteria bacterium]